MKKDKSYITQILDSLIHDDFCEEEINKYFSKKDININNKIDRMLSKSDSIKNAYKRKKLDIAQKQRKSKIINFTNYSNLNKKELIDKIKNYSKQNYDLASCFRKINNFDEEQLRNILSDMEYMKSNNE